MHSDVYKSGWFKLDMMIETIVIYFDTSLIDLDHNSRSQECEKAKTSVLITSQRYQWIWMKFVETWWCDETHFHFRSSVQYSRETTLLMWFCLKNKPFNTGLYSDNYRPISFKLGAMIVTPKLYILISVWVTLTFSQGHSCMRNQKLQCPFSPKFKYWFG